MKFLEIVLLFMLNRWSGGEPRGWFTSAVFCNVVVVAPAATAAATTRERNVPRSICVKFTLNAANYTVDRSRRWTFTTPTPDQSTIKPTFLCSHQLPFIRGSTNANAYNRKTSYGQLLIIRHSHDRDHCVTKIPLNF